MALYFSIFEDHAVVDRYVPEDGYTTVLIPAEMKGVPVTQIGPGAFKQLDSVEMVVIPMTLERIGNEAFAFCEKLACVGVVESESHSVFPSGLQYVGERAFCGTAMKDVSFASEQLELDRQCFHKSKVTTAFFVGSQLTLREGAFMESDLEIISMTAAEPDLLGGSCFARCKRLRTVAAKRINAVGDSCFAECVELKQLPVKKPLEQVGERAFFGCDQLKTGGYFRTMKDVISALGTGYLVEETVKLKCPGVSRQPEYYSAYSFRLDNAAHRVLEKLGQTEAWPVSDLLLLNVVGSKYYDMDDGWDYTDHFFLYAKKDIKERFREIWDWNLTTADWFPVPRPPMRSFYELSGEEVYRMLSYELSPKPYAIDWDDLELLLNAELGGDAAFYNYRMVTDFLSRLIDHEMGNTPEAYCDIPTEEIEEKLFGDEKDCMSDEEKLHLLTFKVLYNRLAIYQELKQAYCQLTYRQPPEEDET